MDAINCSITCHSLGQSSVGTLYGSALESKPTLFLILWFPRVEKQIARLDLWNVAETRK